MNKILLIIVLIFIVFTIWSCNSKKLNQENYKYKKGLSLSKPKDSILHKPDKELSIKKERVRKVSFYINEAMLKNPDTIYFSCPETKLYKSLKEIKNEADEKTRWYKSDRNADLLIGTNSGMCDGDLLLAIKKGNEWLYWNGPNDETGQNAISIDSMSKFDITGDGYKDLIIYCSGGCFGARSTSTVEYADIWDLHNFCHIITIILSTSLDLLPPWDSENATEQYAICARTYQYKKGWLRANIFKCDGEKENVSYLMQDLDSVAKTYKILKDKIVKYN